MTSQINQNTTINSGFLADAVGTPLFNAFQAIQAAGGFNGTLTTAQKAFLTTELCTFQSVQTNLTNVVAQNGLMQSETTNAQTDLGQRQTMLQGLIANATGANLAQASTDLQQAQLAVQAAGQVFQSLKAASLLNLITPTPTG